MLNCPVPDSVCVRADKLPVPLLKLSEAPPTIAPLFSKFPEMFNATPAASTPINLNSEPAFIVKFVALRLPEGAVEIAPTFTNLLLVLPPLMITLPKTWVLAIFT